MDKYRFLSEEWFAAVREVRDSTDHESLSTIDDGAAFNIRIRVGGPEELVWLHFADGTFHRGRRDDCDTEVRIQRDVAYSLLVDGDFSAATKAFMAGKIDIRGDLTQLMAFAMGDGGGVGAAADDVQDRIRAFTI
ncbi:MAG TPA: SCP2 sterol-binding domain-containing protein [Acidimicrobiales bacterium]|jgi:putative sterol carrier protein